MSAALVFLVLSFFGVVTFLITRYFKSRRFNHLLKKLPSPPGSPLLGHTAMFRNKTELLDTITKHVDENDGLALFRIGPLVNYFAVADHELAKKLCTSASVRKSPRYRLFERWLGASLFTLEGKSWKTIRDISTPAFHVKVLKQFVETFNATSNVLVERLKNETHKPIDIYPHINLCALDIIAETAMGVPLNAQANAQSEYVRSVHEMLRIIATRLASPIRQFDWAFRLTKDYRKEQTALKVLKGYTNSIIQSRVKAITNSKAPSRRGLLDVLLESKMSDLDVSNLVEGVMFAGHDTGASGTACILYLLAQHPQAQQRAFEEVKEIYGNDEERGCTFEDLQRMRYLEMVVKEGLRLYPPAAWISKELTEDIEHNGYTLPKGLTAIVMLYSIHRRGKYFPNPNQFEPERFAAEANFLPYTYIPFGGGPRVCIGQRFAMLEMKVVVSKILRKYELLPVEGFKMELLPRVVLKPSENGIQVRLRLRQ